MRRELCGRTVTFQHGGEAQAAPCHSLLSALKKDRGDLAPRCPCCHPWSVLAGLQDVLSRLASWESEVFEAFCEKAQFRSADRRLLEPANPQGKGPKGELRDLAPQKEAALACPVPAMLQEPAVEDLGLRHTS
ncbi:PREDICTED: melanoma-associated antigen C3-like [Colobus angolensis palliatus]|uniref:melanoma-associated antigen C3-like n=1 Tax=Colobus angolensis palliatus TaxID=336983 RepID=UPI0005F4FE5D|nr:PREDICTED: melanoma-associated antigen C3-like [Colobus angolensis palliatus]